MDTILPKCFTADRPEPAAGCDIAAVIKAQSVTSWLQPIFSIKERKVIALETMTQAIDPLYGRAIDLDTLYGAAARQGLLRELDGMCLKRAIEDFAKLAPLDPDLIAVIRSGHRRMTGR